MDNSFVEKRKLKRYNVTDFVVAAFSNRLGRLMNISENGLAVQLMDDTDLESLPEEFKTSLLIVAKGFLVEDLPLKLVRKETMPSSYLSTIAAKFDTSDTIQLGKIKEYIAGLS